MVKSPTPNRPAAITARSANPNPFPPPSVTARKHQPITSPTEITIRGRCVRIDAIGYDNDPQYEGRITLVSQQEIKIPTGLGDLVSPASADSLWQREVFATWRQAPDASLVLLDINETDEDETASPSNAPHTAQPSLPLSTAHRNTA